MSDDDSLKKTRKEGLSDAAREALELAEKDPHEAGLAHGGVGSARRDSDDAVDSEHHAAKLADAKQPTGGSAPKSTPHGGEDVGAHKKPRPTPDSDDEAPLATYKKIDPLDREKGEHRGPHRASDHDAREAAKSEKKERRLALVLAEYSTPGACMRAAEQLRDAGYTRFDTHTPFPVHGMDRAMGLPDSRLGWIVLCCGLTGVSCAFAMMYWMNGVDYPIVIGGKPPGAVPSMVPIMFELTVLFSSFGAVFGMFHLNKIPQHHHPIFESDRFRGFSDDKFFVSVEAQDPKFKLERTRELLEKSHADHVELVEEEVP